MSVTPSDPWVFRDGRQTFLTTSLLQELRRSIEHGRQDSEAKLNAVIRAGEIEASLADLGLPEAKTAAAITDTIAASIFNKSEADLSSIARCLSLLDQIALPVTLAVSPPEGFSYYALHPLDFATASLEIADPTRSTAVVGVRSIGTTLSAMVSAALRSEGRMADRISVRPTGHPYDRIATFTAQDQCWITDQLSCSATFLIVDEGPGRSGSTFLSVADALVAAGVLRSRIVILGSHRTDPQQLCCRDAVSRWSNYQFHACSQGIPSQFANHFSLGAGEWRRVLVGEVSQWPPSWPQMERLKFLSRDRMSFFKFEGLGRVGEIARERIALLHSAGFSPDGKDCGNGFVRYDFIHGRHPLSDDISSGFLERVAQYCAFRDSEFRASRSDSSPAIAEHANPLGKMAQFNFAQEFGTELPLDLDALSSANPVVADGRMQPYEWIFCKDGCLLKTDAISHGDDHFFPGPCDITWDMAGAAIEWNLNVEACEYLLSRFQHFTGRDLGANFSAFVIAYTVFRLSMCRMAMASVAGTPEEARLRRARDSYRSSIPKALRSRRRVLVIPTA
ncbi:MAG: hypothetical protein NVS1B11_01290 [Terriglobales bacterium]